MTRLYWELLGAGQLGDKDGPIRLYGASYRGRLVVKFEPTRRPAYYAVRGFKYRRLRDALADIDADQLT